MPVIAIESTRFSGVVKYEFDPATGYTRDYVVINDPAGGVYHVGSVLGLMTSGAQAGKYRLSILASTDGSQAPTCLYIADTLGQSFDLTVVANTDVKVTALKRGPAIVADYGLNLGTGITTAMVKTAFAALNPPILVETAI